LESPENVRDAKTLLSLVRLGLEHEMQHQELLVYDIKHLLCDQFDAPVKPLPKPLSSVEGMAEIEGGLFWLGYEWKRAELTPGRRLRTETLHSTTRKPAHQVFLQDYAIDKAPVSNGDFLEFINDGGYQNFRWWFSEGWEAVNREQWRAPLYWELHDGEWMIRDFSGLHPAASKKTSPCLTSVTSKPQRLRSGPANDCRPKRNGKRRRVMMRVATSGQHFRGATLTPQRQHKSFRERFLVSRAHRRLSGRREQLTAASR
jgi:hypothetical protein